MTCIVGVINKEKKKVIIGADSAAVTGLDIIIRKDPKVFKNGKFLIGATSSFRMIQLLRYSFSPPKIGDKDLYEYMCVDFINEIRRCFEEGGFLQKFEEGDDKGGTFLVAYKDRLFKVDSDFQIEESINDFSAIGCGESYALGSLYSSSNLTPQKRVKKALEAASYFSGGVYPPFILKNT